jgi:plastocyanin
MAQAYSVRTRTTLIVLASLLAVIAATEAGNAATVIALTRDSVRPNRVLLHLGEAVRWHNKDDVSRRIVSIPAGLFHTERIRPTDTSRRVFFESAGTYRYVVAHNSDVTGTIRVPVKLRPGSNVSPTVGTIITLRVATERRADRAYDVQRKRGNGTWVNIATRTRTVRFKFQLRTPGTYWFRARTVRLTSGVTSRWSPPRKEVLNTPPP